MTLSDTQYARSGDIHIAYQVHGQGPLDIVYVPGWVSHVELAWEEPTLARFLNRLASFARLITFDKRGTGLSDRVPDDRLPTHEERMDDLRAVMDAVGSNRAAFFGFSEGGNLCALFAATYPERTAALVMFGTFAKRIRSSDYPWAPTPEERQREYEHVEREWGNLMDLSRYIPSKIGDEAWKTLLESHDRLCEKCVERFRGRLIKRTGDGIHATFDGPGRAISCAREILDGARDLGVGIRAGLHTGECEIRGEETEGVAVHLAARVAALADAGEVLVSRTVRDLVAGSGLEFTDRGTHKLRGFPEEWQVFSVI